MLQSRNVACPQFPIPACRLDRRGECAAESERDDLELSGKGGCVSQKVSPFPYFLGWTERAAPQRASNDKPPATSCPGRIRDKFFAPPRPGVTLPPLSRPMQHRHLNHHDFTLAAVDDIIRRGGSRDWVQLRRAAHRDAAVLARVQRICGTAAASPSQEGTQRLNFWRKYARRLTASVG